ncbi:MAG: ABC transporter permease subunit [Thermoplasmata archaeon]|nr:ABC transporter permease subunit [Thermoplasmata archaeon]
MTLVKKISDIISKKSTIKAWYGLVIFFFICVIIVPTLFVLSYAVTGWNDIEGTIFTDPADPAQLNASFGMAGTNVSFHSWDIIDITQTTVLEANVLYTDLSGPYLLTFQVYEMNDDGTEKIYYEQSQGFTNGSDPGSFIIFSNDTYNSITHVGPVTQNITLATATGEYLDSWEADLYLRAGDRRPMDLIWDAMKISFVIATIVTIVDFIAGLPMAWLMVRKEFRGKKYLDILIDMPLAIPTAALGFSTALFWAVTPAIPGSGLGWTSSPFLLIILLHIVFSYPYMVRSLTAILHEIDINYETAAQTLGAPPLTVARTITLPLFRAGLVTGIILCFARSLSETGGTMAALAMLTPWLSELAVPMQTGPTLIGAWKHAGGFEPQLAFTAMLLVMVSLVLLVIVKIVIMKFKLPLRKVMPGPERLLSKGLFPKMKDLLAFVFMFVILIIPSFFIVSFLFTGTPTPVDWGSFWSAMGFSFLVAGVITVINILFGVPLAIYIVRGTNKTMSNILDVLVNVPLIVPTSALGVSLGMFWGSMNINVAIFLVISAHLAFTFPLIVRNVAGALEELDPTYEETARTLGARPMFVFKKVMYPSIKFSILAGAIMAFTRSLGETGATLSVVQNANTVPVYIVGLVKSASYYPAALACVVLIVITFITMMIMRYITKKAER